MIQFDHENEVINNEVRRGANDEDKACRHNALELIVLLR